MKLWFFRWKILLKFSNIGAWYQCFFMLRQLLWIIKLIMCLIWQCFYAGRILSSLRNKKSCEDHNGSEVKPQEENPSQASHIAQFLPTSRRIVQFSNGKVFFGCLCHACSFKEHIRFTIFSGDFLVENILDVSVRATLNNTKIYMEAKMT